MTIASISSEHGVRRRFAGFGSVAPPVAADPAPAPYREPSRGVLGFLLHDAVIVGSLATGAALWATSKPGTTRRRIGKGLVFAPLGLLGVLWVGLMVGGV